MAEAKEIPPMPTEAGFYWLRYRNSNFWKVAELGRWRENHWTFPGDDVPALSPEVVKYYDRYVKLVPPEEGCLRGPHD